MTADSSSLISPTSGLDTVKKRDYEELLLRFICPLGVNPHQGQRSCHSLTEKIFTRIKQVTPDPYRAKRLSKVGALVAIYFYPSHCAHKQYIIGLYTSFYLVLDDTGQGMVDDIRQFQSRLRAGSTQPALFELLEWLLVQFDASFPSVSANKLFAGINSSLSMLEVEFDHSTEFTGIASPLFPKYFRNMTGSSEAYVYFILPLESFSPQRMRYLLQAAPELLNVTDEINDLLSFYKESIVGDERTTFVYDHARVHGVSLLQTLVQLSDDIHRRRALIDRIFQDDPELLALGRQYIVGQVEFYLTSERYRLSEIEWAL